MAGVQRPFHMETQAFMDLVVKYRSKPYHEMTSLEEARASSKLVSVSLAGPYEYDGTERELFVPVAGAPGGIPIFVYNPRSVPGNSTAAILVYFHGGGTVVGCRENVATTCKTLSSGAQCIVVNVEYRLAPEHKFPIWMDDCCEVTRWVLANRVELGGGVTSKVGVAGDSAGGQIAASVSHDVPGLAFSILIYPRVSRLDDRSLPSYEEYKDGPVLTTALVDWFDKAAVADVSEFSNPRVANLLRPKFDHLPPTLIVLAECDQLREDGLEYAKRLNSAGVHTEVHLARGAIHAFYTLPGHFVELCREAYQKTVQFIRTYANS